MGSFTLCALALVLMDLFATLVIYTLEFSDYPSENAKNGLILFLLVFLGATSFLYPIFKLISLNWRAKKVLHLWEAIIQALPSIGLLFVFLNHAKKIFDVGAMLWSAGKIY